jgi:hypothetical protein
VLTDEKNEPQVRPEPATPTPSRVRGERWWAIGIVALVALPLVVSAFYLWFSVGSDFLPPVDWALFELQTRDALDHGVFVGPYSRYGWNHPGPLMFYVLAVPYKLMGSRSISMHITALAVNAGTIATIGWVAWRRGRLPVLITVMVPVALLTHALGADVLRQPWNPYLPVLPLLLLLLLAWSVAVRDVWMFPIAIGVASFTIQTHVGLALESVALLLAALAGMLVHGLRTSGAERGRWWRRSAEVGGVSALVFLILWAPVVYGTLVDDDGNIERILRFFTAGRKTAGLQTSLEVMGLQWGPRPEWIFGARGFGVVGQAFLEPRWWVAVWLVLGVAAVAVAIRRRSYDTVWLGGVIAIGLVAALLAAGNIIELVFPYLIRWTWVLGTALGILVLQGLWLAIPPGRRAGALRFLAPVAAVVIAVFCVLGTVAAVDAGKPFALQQASERTVTREVLAHLPPGDGPVLIDTSRGGSDAPGIALALERRGIPVEVLPSQPIVYGARRNDSGGPYRAVLTVVKGDEEIAAFTPPGPRIAHYIRQRNAADLRAIEKVIEEAERTPAGPNREQLLDLARRGSQGPAEEVAVYLSERPI